MKKIITFLFLTISITTTAQVTKLFQNEPYSSRYLFSDSIKMALPSSFRLADSLKISNQTIYAYYDSSKNYININFYKAMDGENKDLRIEGTPVISGAKITGTYLELFAIWKKYFDPNADMIKIQKDRQARLGKIRFGTYSTDWVIHEY